MSKVGCIIVLYNIDKENLGDMIHNYVNKALELCLVDNSDIDNSNAISAALATEPICSMPIKYIPLNGNKGIAYAQNRGIEYFSSKGFDYVMFCDQDSVIHENTVNKLLSAADALYRNNIKMAAVGTMPYNKKTGFPYPLKSKTINDKLTVEGIKLTETYSLISSASLMRVDSFSKVGFFNEDLFIDGVDHEWCWRAWHKCKMRSFVVDDAVIYHFFGEGDKKLAGKSISIASSFRLYYQYRNYLLLLRMPHTPRYWKRKNGIKYFVKMIYYPIFVKPRMSNLRNIIRGIISGL